MHTTNQSSNATINQATAKALNVDAKGPKATTKAPNVDAKGSNAPAKAPNVDAKGPKATTKGPNVDAKGPNSTMKAPKPPKQITKVASKRSGFFRKEDTKRCA